MLHPQVEAIRSLFTQRVGPLWSASATQATFWGLEDRLSLALKQAAATEHLTQGLEQIEKILAKEAKGIQLLRDKTGQPDVARLSRLVLLSHDGSERFYRRVETILKAHANRAWAVVVDASAETLGKLTNPWRTPVKAVLLADRRALELFLSNLVKEGGLEKVPVPEQEPSSETDTVL